MTETSRYRALTAASVLFLLLGLVLVAWNIPLPLIAFSPGPVSDAVDSIQVDGAETYPAEGELMMLTVAGQDINAFEAMVAAVDPTVDVVARQAVRRPDESDEAYRRRNLELMDQSTATAIAVALDHLDVGGDPAVFVVGYAADTPAADLLRFGDEILEFGGKEIGDLADLADALAAAEVGDEVMVVVDRDGEVHEFPIELVAQEDDPERPMIGIFVRELPFWINVDAGIVGGPSAGLMYTLAIMDLLTPDSLTAGHAIAGTGTIDIEGNVGNIGFVRQKVVAAEAAGAEYMLVPQGNYSEASSAPRGEMELVPVSTLSDALDFLESLR